MEVRTVRQWLGWQLRCLADRVDRAHAPVAFGGYWNHTKSGVKVTTTDGIRVRPEVPGVPLWYMSSDYDRAWIGLDK